MLLISILLISISNGITADVKKLKKKYRIQGGEIIYSDLNIPAKPLFSKRYRISGKPDYIVKKKGHYIPIEVKTSICSEPQKNHLLQLAAYCQLLEDTYDCFVPYGILVYDNTLQYKIPFDPKLRFELETTIKKMRNMLKKMEINRNHEESQRCVYCSMREYCEYMII